MSLSKRYLCKQTTPVTFSADALGSDLRKRFPEVDFCLLFGSSCHGTVPVGSDLDLAFHLNVPATLRFYADVAEVVQQYAPDVHCDIGILNRAEPIYRFEALKGRLLFARDRDHYAQFFSLTCREYESQMIDYEKQLNYRREALKHAV